MNINDSIIYILIEELVENDLLNLEELQQKYSLTKKQYAKIKKIIYVMNKGVKNYEK